MADITVTGLADLQKLLDTLPAKIEANIMRAALTAGAKDILAQAKATCPIGDPSGTGAKKYKLYPGALRDSLRVSSRIKNGVVSASVIAGGKSKKTGADVWYAHIIEFTGARPHKIKAAPGHALAIGGGAYSDVNHPGMSSRPFLRAALDTQAQNAITDIGEYIKKRLATKEGLDTADIMIEVGE